MVTGLGDNWVGLTGSLAGEVGCGSFWVGNRLGLGRYSRVQLGTGTTGSESCAALC